MGSNEDNTEAKMPVDCFNCKTTMAQFWCADCSNNYCSNCCELIHKRRLFFNHRTMKIQEKSSESVRCAIHADAEIKYWCYTCERVICDDCLKTEHQSHQYTTTNKAANEISGELKNSLKELQSSLDSIAEYVTKISEVSDTISIETVTEAFAAIRQLIDEKEEVLKQEVLEIQRRQKMLMQKHKTQLKDMTDSLQQNNTYFESLVSANEHVKLLQANDQLGAYIRRFSNDLGELQPLTKTEYQIKGIDQLQTAVEEGLKQVEIAMVEQNPEPAQSDQSASLSKSSVACGGEACATCSKCIDWKWDKQKKKWIRSPDAKCIWNSLPKYHALLPWHYLCHGH